MKKYKLLTVLMAFGGLTMLSAGVSKVNAASIKANSIIKLSARSKRSRESVYKIVKVHKRERLVYVDQAKRYRLVRTGKTRSFKNKIYIYIYATNRKSGWILKQSVVPIAKYKNVKKYNAIINKAGRVTVSDHVDSGSFNVRTKTLSNINHKYITVDLQESTGSRAQYVRAQMDGRKLGWLKVSDVKTVSGKSFLKPSKVSQPLVYIAHRGYNVEAPEESIAAYTAATKLGYRDWEADIHYTADDVPVMIHDPYINRVARNRNGSKISKTFYVRNCTLEELNDKYDFGIIKGKKFKNTKILTLANFLKLAREKKAFIHIEFKDESDGVAVSDSNVQKVMNMVAHEKLQKQTGVEGFNFQDLIKVKNVDPTVNLEYLGEQVSSEYLSHLAELKTNRNTVVASIRQNVATPANLKNLIGHNFPVYVWTMSDGSLANKLHQEGIKAIITNGQLKPSHGVKLHFVKNNGLILKNDQVNTVMGNGQLLKMPAKHLTSKDTLIKVIENDDDNFTAIYK